VRVQTSEQAALKRQASASFLKKRSKKLLVPAGAGTVLAKAPSKEKFFSFLNFAR
jgi:hypothetical protein